MEEVIVKYLTGNANNEERNEVIRWLNESVENRRYFDQLKDVHEAAIVSDNERHFDADKSWQRIRSEHYKQQLEKEKLNLSSIKRRNIITIFSSVAAVFIIAFFLGGGVFRYLLNNNKASEAISEVIAPFGSRVFVTLPDSTKVWLNAGSKLRYSTNFLQASRDVNLEGEGYFEVKKMSDKKFIVHTSHLNVKVYGTSFNVKAYPDEKTIETTLVKGSVAIEGSDEKLFHFEPFFLKPNQKATFTKSTKSMLTADKDVSNKQVRKPLRVEQKEDLMVISPKVNPVVYTSWKDNRWIIDGEELQKLAVKLERRYDVKILFESESLKNYRFSGTLTDETLEQVLNIIKISAPIDYVVENKNVVLKSNRYFKKKYDELLIKH